MYWIFFLSSPTLCRFSSVPIRSSNIGNTLHAVKYHYAALREKKSTKEEHRNKKEE